MVRRRPGADKEQRRRIVPSGTRRTVVGKAKRAGVTLDDAPISVRPMRDQKRLLVCLPHDLWVVKVEGEDLSYAQNLELDAHSPSVSEAEQGELWIGGKHLLQGSAFHTKASKFGSKLGGYVDDVALLRPGLLCGVGHQGEVIIDLSSGDVLHRRKAKGNRSRRVSASADERAIFVDESSSAWVIDPAHPGGYTKLRFEQSADEDIPEEAIVLAEVDHKGRCLLAARDGAIAWTTGALRRAGERWVDLPPNERSPLGIAADDTWMYVLRPQGRVQRFLIAPPQATSSKKGDSRGHRRGAQAVQETPPLPEAQEVRLERAATCMCAIRGEGAPRLVFGGSQSQGMLGRLWSSDPETLAWTDIEVVTRPERQAKPPDSSAPNFEKIRNKLNDAPRKIAKVDVDHVLSGKHNYWVTHANGNLLERAVSPLPVTDLLPGDALLLPAMVRPREGTARPALLLWPGIPERREGDPPPILWLCWGDNPRGWMPLETPEIRAQRWTRSEFFPMQIALRGLPEAPGKRARLPKSWVDAELFDALAKECKKMLKVLW